MASAGIDGPAAFQDESQDLGSQIQILTVGHLSSDEAESDSVSSTQAYGKQDLRVTMLKKGTGHVLDVRSGPVLGYTGGLYCAVLCCAVPCSTVMCCAALCRAVM